MNLQTVIEIRTAFNLFFVLFISAFSFRLVSTQENAPFENLFPQINNLFPTSTEGSSTFLSELTGETLYRGVNLVPFGPGVGDHEVFPDVLSPGQMIQLQLYFPFYGGLYNYTIISVNGYLGFAQILNQGPVLNVGVDSTDWPRQPDPAMIAPWLCKQQINQERAPGYAAGVYYRLVLRQALFGRRTEEENLAFRFQETSFFNQPASKACPGTRGSYIQCNEKSDAFLEQMMQWLQEGVAGAAAFKADAALVVTWYNTAPGISGQSDMYRGQLATYQVIWLTDETAKLSYVILNYDKLGFDADDLNFNSRTGRCRALFNGGNHTGTVPISPTEPYKISPKILAQQSGVPHIVRGRYMFRVDDVVRPCGCSNKTSGTYPITIYPNIVNMLGETAVDVNALCLNKAQSYVLMIEQRETANCVVLNPSIARCYLPRVFDWGTKTVYFQPQQGNLNAQENRAFVGYIYFVPPTIDPMRLDVGNTYDWFKNPIPFRYMPLSWYPRNFTNPEITLMGNSFDINSASLYTVQLGLYVIGYREAQDNKIKKFRPDYRTLCRLATYTNEGSLEYRFKPQEEKIDLNKVEEWYLDEWERDNLLYKFRFGYLKLAPVSPPRSTDNNAFVVRPGLVSAPIGLQWLWPLAKGIPISATFSPTEQAERLKFVEKKATEMCHEWYEEDGAQYNFIRYTETNASCPCVESQAIMDLGRFMPHPRCSQVFRDISCSTMIGANNCYMSAQNIYSSYYAGDNDDFNSKNTAPFPTHYGQVCCYDAEGKLMQSNYVPVIKVIEQTPYNPGYPVRAYEFGTYPYMGQYEVPGFSTFYHDTMPYFFCCKYAKFRCQLFYWRRPTSGCQEYRSAAAGYVQGAAAFETIDNQKFIFDEPGVFTLLHISKTLTNPEVRVQIRLERYPNRRVDFGLLGRYLSQADLVQPTNATVVTGVALEASGTDRVVVVVRKDTRRFRYRTSIIVGNIIRYFDNMRIQRFRGVMVYVNNVERGQAEVYVVLEEAEVGVRIRESYALDITRLPMYQESMGLLDVKLSISPKYGVRPNADSSEYITIMDGRRFPRVYGLMRPSADGNPLLNDVSFGLNSVNAESVRKELINNYKILGSGEPGSKQPSGVSNSGTPTDNMFTTSLDDDRRYEVYPEAALKRLAIYKTARKFDQYPYQFVAKTGSNLSNLIQQCTDLEKNPQKDYKMELQLLREYGSSPCPEAPTAITSLCGDNIPCLNDYTLLRSKVLGIEALNNWDNFLAERRAGSKHYNSCGAIMIEYPSYMLKTPSMTSGYLEGDTASFSCYQTHWIKGDYDYKCSKTYSSDSADYLFGWNKGWQPWCRSRELDNLLKWLTAIFSTIGIIMFLIIVFAAFWSIKQRRRKVDDMNRVQYSSRKGFDPRRFNIREDDAKRGRKTASETNGDLGRHAEREEQRSMGVTSTNKVTSPERLSPPELRSRGQLPRDLPFMGFNTSV